MKAPEFAKLPPSVRVVDGKVTVEVAFPMVKFAAASAELAPKLHAPVPEDVNVRVLNLFDPVILPFNVFPEVAALKRTVPLL